MHFIIRQNITWWLLKEGVVCFVDYKYNTYTKIIENWISIGHYCNFYSIMSRNDIN